MMLSDSITYTSFEAIWGENVGNDALRCFVKSGLIDKPVLELQNIVLLL